MRDFVSGEESALRQLESCRALLAETLYCNRQLETVIRLKDIELAEQSNTIEHLRGKLKVYEDVCKVIDVQTVKVMCG